jgi:Fe-S-cluster containining protein
MDLLALKEDILAKFECQKSGNCCRREGVVYATVPEMKAMADFLGINLGDFIQRFTQRKDGWYMIASPTHRPTCFLTPENTCSVYQFRPKACKTYPHWPSIWMSEEDILTELALCPGLKKAFEKATEC